MNQGSFVCAQLNGFKYCYLLFTYKWFQVLLSNTNSSIGTQLNGFKYSKWLNSSIWPIDGTLIVTTTLGLSGPRSNGNEEIHHMP